MNQGLESNKHDIQMLNYSLDEGGLNSLSILNLKKPFNGTLCSEVLNYFELFCNSKCI